MPVSLIKQQAVKRKGERHTEPYNIDFDNEGKRLASHYGPFNPGEGASSGI